MDGSAFSRLPVKGIMWFGVFGLAVAGLVAAVLAGGVIYVLIRGVEAIFA